MDLSSFGILANKYNIAFYVKIPYKVYVTQISIPPPIYMKKSGKYELRNIFLTIFKMSIN